MAQWQDTNYIKHYIHMTKLKDIKDEWNKYIVLKDDRAVDMLLATCIGNMLIDLDPIWLMIVAPSSGGKTTLLSPIVDIKNVYFVDDLTEKTLLSGYSLLDPALWPFLISHPFCQRTL